MPRVAPFVALRYDAAVAGDLGSLTAPPYDVISGAGRARLSTASPFNVVHLDLAEGSDVPGAAGNRYDAARSLLADWEAAGVVKLDPAPAYLAYELTWSDGPAPAGTIRGLLCSLLLEPWGGSVVPHEHTMPGPVRDRLELLRATATHLSPIYGTVAGPIAPLASLLDGAAEASPIADLVDPEGVRHRLWQLPADPSIADLLREEELLIADGHHRYTTALAYRDERRRDDGPGPWDGILAFIVDAGSCDVPVLPYHRVQRRGDVPQPAHRVADLAALEAAVDDEATVVGVIAPAADGLAYGTLPLPGAPPAVRALHAAYLDEHAPGDALRFTHSAVDAERAVAGGEAVAAYVVPPTTTERVRAAIHLGERLPRKSTFFWPKPRTGMAFMPVR